MYCLSADHAKKCRNIEICTLVHLHRQNIPKLQSILLGKEASLDICVVLHGLLSDYKVMAHPLNTVNRMNLGDFNGKFAKDIIGMSYVPSK